MMRLRVGSREIETLDSVRFGHLLDFARGTGKSWPALEFVAQHPNADAEIEWRALVDELQRLAQERPPEHLAPLIGLLRNDATRVARMAGADR
jgi:hypothetical protein